MKSFPTEFKIIFLTACLAFTSSCTGPKAKPVEGGIIVSNASVYRKLSSNELKSKLTQEQFDVTQCSATEAPFKNAYWNHKAEGIYVDVVTGEPLYSSKDKFDSGTGWPSFTKPIHKQAVVEAQDTSHGMVRTEVRSRVGDSHLGHLFNDGPGPGGLRYCINSAALRFVAVKNLEKEGYGAYKILFQK